MLIEPLAGPAALDEGAVDHLRSLLGDWQILADLSFADLLLFVPHEVAAGNADDVQTEPAYLCVGQMRPLTTQTIYVDDLVGQVLPAAERPLVTRAFDTGRIIRDADPDWSTGVPVREEAIPVRYGDRIIAVVTREANVSTARSPSSLELTYLHVAGALATMLADGTFPYPAGDVAPEERELSPRVGDGVVHVDASGTLAYASPNAVSAYRRLGVTGNIEGVAIVDVDPDPTLVLEALSAGVTSETEVEDGGGVLLRRVLPVLARDRPTEALLLVRDVTELRRQERALRLKDATIREIHHRVKNNLQTVASLLRLQARRLTTDEGRAALQESVRRIASIAVVHETLSRESTRQLVDFGEVVDRVVRLIADGLTDPDSPVDIAVQGRPGLLPAGVATPLALVISELLQNSVEHAFPQLGASDGASDGVADGASDGVADDRTGRDDVGRFVADRLTDRWADHSAEHRVGGARIVVRFERTRGSLRVVIADNGVGLPRGTAGVAGPGLDAVANLGLRIVRTLVESELGGTFAALTDDAPGTAVDAPPSVADGGGTVWELVVPLA